VVCFPRAHLLQNSFRMLTLALRQLESSLRAEKNFHDSPPHARLSALTDHLVRGRRRSTVQARLRAARAQQSSAERGCDSAEGTGGLSQTAGPCVVFCTSLANYWCLAGELRASVWGVLGCPGRHVVCNATGLRLRAQE